MAQTKINASQTTITASDIGAARATTTLPAASASTAGQIYQYTGSTTSSYTNGYFYKGTKNEAAGTATATKSSSVITSVTVDAATFYSVSRRYFGDSYPLSGANVFTWSSDYWGWVAPNGTTIDEFWPNFEAEVTGMRALGITITPEWASPSDGDTITITYTPGAVTYAWENVLVSPGLANTATGNNSVSIATSNPTAAANSLNIGNSSSVSSAANWSTALGYTATISSDTGVVVGASSRIGSNAGGSTAVGQQAVVDDGDAQSTVIGNQCTTWGANSVAIGYFVCASAHSIGIGSTGSQFRIESEYSIGIGGQIGYPAFGAIQIGYGTNSTAGTLSIGLKASAADSWNNYRLLDVDGTIPTDRFTTTPVADGTYVPTLTISSGTAARSWSAPSGAPTVPSTMPTLAVNDWSSNTQTVNVTGVTASNVVFVSPAPASAADYAAAGITCTAQGSGTLTFTCTTVPSNAITVNIVIFG